MSERKRETSFVEQRAKIELRAILKLTQFK